MNEILLVLLIPIILTGFAYVIAEILMRLFSIKHPKNSFFVYFLVFIIAFSFIPLTYIAISESTVNNMDKSSTIDEANDMKKKYMENISTSQISSKITPLCNKYIKEDTIESMPSRFLIEISWIDFIVDETKSEEKPLTDTNKDQDIEDNVEKSNEPAFISSTLNIFEKTPPLLIALTILTLIANLFFIYHLFIGKRHYLKKIKAYKLKNPSLLALVEQLSNEIHIKIPKVYIYDGIPNAFVIGHPAILVISDSLLDVLSEKELKTTLKHELTHIKHHDVLLKAFIQSVRILCFYNPFIHLAAKKIFNKRELLADLSYNQSKEDKISFMEALIKITEYTQSLSKSGYKLTPAISVSLLELCSFHPTMTERFFSLFKQWKKKTFLTLLVSIVILFANGSAILFTHSYFSTSIESENLTDEIVHVEEQYLVEDVTYTTFYQNNERYEGKMVHKTLYNVISLPAFANNNNLRDIIEYIILNYYKSQQETSAF